MMNTYLVNIIGLLLLSVVIISVRRGERPIF